MGCEFRSQTSYSRFLAENPEQMKALAEKLVQSGTLLVMESPEEIVGMLGFFIYPHYLSGEVVAGELFWWVEPEHRGNGLKLLDEMERRARERCAKVVQMVAPTEELERVYKMLRFEKVESTWQRPL
jgi:RimJ/RimL family protein N-acetyltransferase